MVTLTQISCTTAAIAITAVPCVDTVYSGFSLNMFLVIYNEEIKVRDARIHSYSSSVICPQKLS
jgi:hypothetical protein